MNPVSMRDAFFERIYELAKYDKDIIIVSADMAAPSLDDFRTEMKDQFINVGISEQNAILIASGLAMAGKKPIAYAITQFISLRALEQIRIYPCGMNLSVSIVGVGAGVGYYESGPTHHVIEDVSIMRTFPKLSIYNASDEQTARVFADFAVNGIGPKYIRLDRDKVEALHDKTERFESGMSAVASISRINIAATGIMVIQALEVRERLLLGGINIGVLDIYRIPVEDNALRHLFAQTSLLITLEEHTLAGGLGGYLLEKANDLEGKTIIKRLGMDTSNGYEKCYNYGGRKAIREEFGLGIDDITGFIQLQALKYKSYI